MADPFAARGVAETRLGARPVPRRRPSKIEWSVFPGLVEPSSPNSRGGQARLDLEAARSELAAIRAARQAISAVLERERTAAALH